MIIRITYDYNDLLIVFKLLLLEFRSSLHCCISIYCYHLYSVNCKCLLQIYHKYTTQNHEIDSRLITSNNIDWLKLWGINNFKTWACCENFMECINAILTKGDNISCWYSVSDCYLGTHFWENCNSISQS